MVFCSIIVVEINLQEVCSFHHLPVVLKHQGTRMLELCSKQCRAWLAAISRADLTEEKATKCLCLCYFLQDLQKLKH